MGYFLKSLQHSLEQQRPTPARDARQCRNYHVRRRTSRPPRRDPIVHLGRHMFLRHPFSTDLFFPSDGHVRAVGAVALHTVQRVFDPSIHRSAGTSNGVKRRIRETDYASDLSRHLTPLWCRSHESTGRDSSHRTLVIYRYDSIRSVLGLPYLKCA